MRIVTYLGRPVARIHALPKRRLLLKLYERLPDGRRRCLSVSETEWVRGRRDLWLDGRIPRSVICRDMAAEAQRRRQAG